MLLFLTREACFSFSIEGLLDMEAEESERSSQAFSDPKRAGEPPRCQKARGEALPYGEESKGDESLPPLPIICWDRS
jgi:hypothetical protein